MSASNRPDAIEETIVSASSGLADRLLVQLATAPPEGELEDALWGLVSAFVDGQDDIWVGVCVPDVKGSQLIVRHAPVPREARIHDAARLFPEALHESISSVPFDEGSTLHVATMHAPDRALARAIEQLAMTLGATIRRARLVESLKIESESAKSLRDSAVQSDKLAGLGRMAANIVHELNNPLTSIVTYADFLKRRFDRDDIDPADRERLGRIADAANRVLAFTRDLVAYSRPSSASPAALSIHDVVERALVFCDHVVSANEISVVRRYAELPPVRGLHGPLTQVFVNLITNACQAMPHGGKLVLESSVSGDGASVLLAVADDGHGIPPEHVDRVFEPYFTTRGEGGGSGLGLDIVRTIVTSHGGRVQADNAKREDGARGAVFTVVLPTLPSQRP
ncbi:MAG TPA: ATP-binding protein [Polyangiaceae bacterium]|nr:ATP-binding protein [Polyangiaceae bacterium]